VGSALGVVIGGMVGGIGAVREDETGVRSAAFLSAGALVWIAIATAATVAGVNRD
jgi:sulfite exporter TauE/SafE